MKRPYGVHTKAFVAYIQACFDAGVGPDRITQTIGNAPASKGYHARDGYFEIDGTRYPYCAAMDLSVRDLSNQQIHLLLERLAESGFAAWWRRGLLWRGNNHIHAVYAGVYMKPQLGAQVSDFLQGKNGLAGHAKDSFVVPSAKAKQTVRALYDAFNNSHSS